MKITSLILSIPPYLSTTWENIASLHMGGEGIFVVLLQNGTAVEVPHLNQEMIQQIFEAHARYLEEKKNPPFILPLKSNGTFELLENSSHHNPDQANLPPLPPDILKKVAMIARLFGLEETTTLAQAEPNCNCIHCQITRSLQGEEITEEVTPEDLTFRDWDIKQMGDQLYSVTNPLETAEQYTVFLGTPLGCTCGQKNCDHIRAVLNS